MNVKNRTRLFDNGLALVAEDMSWSESIAFAILIPAGSVNNPAGKDGLASLTCEMTNRGAGDLDNRSFLEAFENLGVDSSESSSHSYASFCASGLAGHWERTLELLAAQIRSPLFPAEEFESCRQTQLQEIAALEDEPARKAATELSRIFFPDPWGRSPLGTEDSLSAATLDDVSTFHRDFFRPNGAIIAVAGRFDWDKLERKVGELFGDWAPRDVAPVEPTDLGVSTSQWPFESAQTQLGLAYRSTPFGAPDYQRAWSGVELLSGGMSSRLFTEVREKRGLCYSVFASYYTRRNLGGVFCYCGTTGERAQESLDVIVSEIDRLATAAPTPSELERLKIRSKSSLVMQRESTGSRASAIARDWYHLGKIRTLEEVLGSINALTCESIEAYFAERGPNRFRLATLGREPLKIAPERLF